MDNHYEYSANYFNWVKFRLTYEGGTDFINTYLYKQSDRETDEDLTIRKKLSYNPAHAKAAINSIKDAIYQRMNNIVRTSSIVSYLQACNGESNGVNLSGDSMNYFMGVQVLTELLVIGKVGVYVEAPSEKPLTLVDSFSPYVYIVKAEDILSWEYDKTELKYAYIIERNYNNKNGINIKYKEIIRVNDEIIIKIYDKEKKLMTEVNLGNISFPLIISEIKQSLMQDIADCQITLLNLSSADINYIMKGNFPFYTEQYETRGGLVAKNMRVNPETQELESTNETEIEVGSMHGRKYPVGAERPAFIHPSPEPLLASMKKQEEIKLEIRQLINLAIQNISPKNSSAESKAHDEKGLEAGLSAIGLELHKTEKRIAQLWTEYLGVENDIVIIYPTNYSLISESDKIADSNKMIDLAKTIPSQTYQKEVLKEVANLTLGSKLNVETLKKIEKEIDNAKNVFISPSDLDKDIKNGLVSTATASSVRGYAEGEVEQAKKDHADRLARIIISQTQGAAAARGVVDLDPEGKRSADWEKEHE